MAKWVPKKPVKTKYWSIKSRLTALRKCNIWRHQKKNSRTGGKYGTHMDLGGRPHHGSGISVFFWQALWQGAKLFHLQESTPSSSGNSKSVNSKSEDTSKVPGPISKCSLIYYFPWPFMKNHFCTFNYYSIHLCVKFGSAKMLHITKLSEFCLLVIIFKLWDIHTSSAID